MTAPETPAERLRLERLEAARRRLHQHLSAEAAALQQLVERLGRRS